MCAHMCTDAQPEARKAYQILYSVTICLVPLSQGFLLQQELGWQPASPIHPPGSSSSPPQSWGYSHAWLHLAFYKSEGDLNSVFIPAVPLLTKPSPQSNYQIYICAYIVCVYIYIYTSIGIARGHLASFAVWWLYHSLFQCIACHTITKAKPWFPTLAKFLD